MNSKMKFSGFKERLSQLIGDEQPFAWASRIGLPGATFNRMWNEGTPPKADHLITIRRGTGCSIDWLLIGEGEMGRTTPETRDKASALESGHGECFGVPLEVLQQPLRTAGEFDAGIVFFMQLAKQKLTGKTPDEVADLIAEMRELFRKKEQNP